MKTRQLLSKTFIIAAMLFGSYAVFAQVKIGSNPTTINAANNLEVEASTSGRKTSIDKTTGQVTVKDGTEGLGKVFTSDANGAGSWQGLKTTSIDSYAQTTPGTVVNMAVGGPLCGFGIGTTPPACAIDLNRNASFNVTNAVSDVLIDVSGAYTVANNATPVAFYILLAIDKTTPGTYETIEYYYITNGDIGCSGQYLNLKSAIKNLPPRTYNVKVYIAPWTNLSIPGGTAATAATIGVGKKSATYCGVDDYAYQKIIVTVNQ